MKDTPTTWAVTWAVSGMCSAFVAGLMAALLVHKGLDWIAVALLITNALAGFYAAKNVAKAQREAA